MTFECKKLKFTHKELEPYLSEENVRLHYEKHTKGYFKKTNELVHGTKFEKMETLKDVLTSKMLKKTSALFNQASQAYNHELWWENLAPKDKTGKPSEELMKQIDHVFGSFDVMKNGFEELGKALFGSGWIWLTLINNNIAISTTGNADSPLTENTDTILLVVDLWEHSWYPTYQNDKVKYLKNIFNIIDWNVVNERYETTRTK